jgi:hypothetical protein
VEQQQSIVSLPELAAGTHEHDDLVALPAFGSDPVQRIGHLGQGGALVGQERQVSGSHTAAGRRFQKSGKGFGIAPGMRRRLDLPLLKMPDTNDQSAQHAALPGGIAAKRGRKNGVEITKDKRLLCKDRRSAEGEKKREEKMAGQHDYAMRDGEWDFTHFTFGCAGIRANRKSLKTAEKYDAHGGRAAKAQLFILKKGMGYQVGDFGFRRGGQLFVPSSRAVSAVPASSTRMVSRFFMFNF